MTEKYFLGIANPNIFKMLPIIKIKSVYEKPHAALSGLFIFSKPSIVNRLDPKEMSEYSENIKESSSKPPDTIMFLDIIQNIKLIDTSLWTDDELPLSLLVNSRDETVSRKYAIQKF